MRNPAGGAPERLTFEGGYNVTPRYAPDGKSFVFIQREGGRFNVATQDFVSRQLQLLTDDGIDESPSFAPNGRYIMYATSRGGSQSSLAVVSVDGRIKQTVTSQAGEVQEPTWGPFVK